MHPAPWEENRRIPRGIAAALAALRFSNPSGERLALLENREWDEVLDFCDRAQLTLALGRTRRDYLPEQVRQRIDKNLSRNAERLERLKYALLEICDTFEAAKIRYVALKGFTQWPRYVSDLRQRVQYDLDFFCSDVNAARDALLALEYEPLKEFEEFPTDHLPAMVRKTGWEWRGDYYDPEIPVSVDLHFRLWDPDTEGFAAPGVDRFWERRVERQIAGRTLPALDPVDGLGYTALHLLRHLLRGNLRVYHVYELAYFLHASENDGLFWRRWRELHDHRLRQLEAVCFRLAAEWFDCRVPAIAKEDVEALPDLVQRWFERHGASPVEAFFHPNKDELWLHLGLVESSSKKRKVLCRRLLPMRMPGPVDAIYIPDAQMTWRLRLRKRSKHFAYATSRTWRHLRLLVPTLWRGSLWWWRNQGLGGSFGFFLAAACLFNLGLFIFVLLYNLYLLDLGFKEDFLGLVAGAMTAGSIAGTLPAGALAQRFGLRSALLVCFGGVAVISAMRAAASGAALLVVLAFLGGIVQSVWAVSIAPVVAQLTDEPNRPRAFSIFFSVGIGMGILGGLIGGRLPQWIAYLSGGMSATGAKQAALLAGCAIAASAVWPAARLRFAQKPVHGKTSFPRSPFLTRFLAAAIVWNLATGAFNPFFNAYFSRFWRLTMERIGLLFSGAQVAQVGAVLLAPLVLRRFGLVSGITMMQAATGIALACLMASPWSYAAYMSFQWMSEPGMYSLLMKHVTPQDQTGASALNYFVIFSSQAIAAVAAGAALARFGYPVVLGAAAAVALIAAVLFRVLLGKFETMRASPAAEPPPSAAGIESE